MAFKVGDEISFVLRHLSENYVEKVYVETVPFPSVSPEQVTLSGNMKHYGVLNLNFNEGITWARGHDTETVEALLAAHALSWVGRR